MERIETRLEGPVLLRPKLLRDARGFFLETYRRSTFAELGIEDEFVQDNHSRSSRGVVRGMHFQIGRGMSKLVRCPRGSVLDVLVDLRKGSPTFGEWESFELDDEDQLHLYCPIGFAHGFCVTSEVADVIYKCDAYHDPEAERAIAYDDPDLSIEWPQVKLLPSERDATAPTLKEIEGELPFTY